MSKAWRCPACHAIVDYADYDQALRGKAFSCRKCDVSLVIDRKTDQPVRVEKPPSKSS
jgi:hypothetical protein